ncbi:MAG: PH domain-containing protein [Candidatus Aenigmatarchaeota archaeon]
MEDPKEIILKPARIYFLGNYIIATLVTIFLLLLYLNFDMKFTLFPTTQSDMISTLIILGIFGIAAAMVEQPEWERFRIKFIVTMNEVMEYKGILNKERVILPYATVADIRVEKSVMGRILNYGTLSVSSFKAGSDMVMKGIRQPEKIHVMIQNRVNLIREGQLEMFGKGKEPEETRKLKATDSIENLENRRKELLELVEQTKQAFYNREIDEQQLARTVEKYQQEIMEIDVKLKKLSK